MIDTNSTNNTTNEDNQTTSTTSKTNTTGEDNQTNSTTSETNSTKDDKITVKVNGNLKEQFRRKAQGNGTNPTNLINQLMWEYVHNTTNTTGEDNQTNSTTSTNNEIEARLATIEAKLEGIDFSDLFTAAHTIEQGSAIAQQNRKSIADLEKVVDELQADSLEVNRTLKGKVNQQQLYERLAAATETIWESMDYMGDKIEKLEHPSEKPPSELPTEATQEEGQGQSILEKSEGNTAQNKGDSENNAQNTDDEGDSASAIAPNEEEKSSSQSEDFVSADLIEGLTQTQLAKRFGKKNSSALNYPKKKGNEHFKKWSKEFDPDDIEWVWQPEDKLFYPVR